MALGLHQVPSLSDRIGIFGVVFSVETALAAKEMVSISAAPREHKNTLHS